MNVTFLLNSSFVTQKASDTMHGKDGSVLDPLLTEKAAAREALHLGKTVPLVKLSIPDEYYGGICYFVTSAPEATLYTPPGCATHGFKAYDVQHGTVVFLKDLWRIDLSDIQAEGQIYKMLRDADVCNVPRYVASGDIGSTDYHTTRTHIYTKKSWACCLAKNFIPH